MVTYTRPEIDWDTFPDPKPADTSCDKGVFGQLDQATRSPGS